MIQYSYLQLKIIFVIQTIFFSKLYLLYVSEKENQLFREDKRSTAHEMRVFKNQSDC